MDEETLQQQVSETEIDSVRDILKTLSKTIKTFNAYPKDNPIYQKAADALFEKFSGFFASSEELSLAVEHNALLYKGKDVYKSDEKTDNIALHLYADGIRDITFQKGITEDELLGFVEILRLAPKIGGEDDDIVTMLWEKNIKNLSYSVVEDTVDEEAIVEESLIQSISEQAEEQATTLHGASYSSLTVKPVSLKIKTDPLTAEEIDALRQEMFSFDEKYLISQAAALFFDLLSVEKDITAFSEIVRNISRITDLRIKAGDIAGTIDILRMLRKIAVISSDPEQTALISEVFAEAASIDNLRTLFKSKTEQSLIKDYLLLLEQSAISSMVNILGELEDRKMRRLLCEVLAEIGRQDIDTLAGFLKDSRWYLVRNIVMVLGMTKEPVALKHLEKIMRHPEVRVRREAIKAIENIGSEDSKRLFLAALKDADPTIRVNSLKALRRFKDIGIFNALKEEARREVLIKKPFGEKREFLETLATAGKEEAFPILAELFKKKGLFEKDESVEIRAAAAYGLGALGMPDAIALLKKGVESRKSLIRDACQKALDASQKALDASQKALDASQKALDASQRALNASQRGVSQK